MQNSTRKKGFLDLGAKNVIFLDFLKFKEKTPKEFLDYIYDEYRPEIISCGYNFRFGKDASGDTETLSDFCKSKNIELSVKSPVTVDGVPLSSTYIRNLIANGQTDKANELIFGGFSVTSAVLHGDKRGRELGFPTVNQLYPAEMVKPKFGVYAAKMIIDGKTYNCISNIGLRPTFETKEVTIESYIFDFCGDIYGKEVTLKPIKFIRPERKFDSAEELVSAINKDIIIAKELLCI